jgi:hypothetical protein
LEAGLHCSGLLQAPIGVIAAYQLTEDLYRKIKQLIIPIDHLLAQILLPENREFEEQELQDKYGFPKENPFDYDYEDP